MHFIGDVRSAGGGLRTFRRYAAVRPGRAAFLHIVGRGGRHHSGRIQRFAEFTVRREGGELRRRHTGPRLLLHASMLRHQIAARIAFQARITTGTGAAGRSRDRRHAYRRLLIG